MVGAVAVLVPSGVVAPSRSTWEKQATMEKSRKMIPDNHRAGLSFNRGSPDRDNDWPQAPQNAISAKITAVLLVI
jgi:hypothetical protein